MAKKSKSSPAKAPPSAPANVEPEVAKKIVELKTAGNNAFARGDYSGALAIYEDAIKLLPANAPEKADFHNNKAACFIGQKRYKEAVKECTSALEVAPNSVRALQRRAKAFEQQGLFKQALQDIVTINKTDNASPETQEQERRLREAAARRPASAANGASAAAPGGAALARGAGAGGSAAGASAAASGANKLSALQQGLFMAKCTLGDETKLVHLSVNNNYADVLAAVQAKFPNAGPFLVKYLDKNGDLVTLTCKADIHVALAELMQQYQRAVAAQGAHGPKLTAFPPLRLHLTPVASAADVPKPPPEEEFERNQLLALQKAQQGADRKDGPAASGPSDEVHLDNWLVDFAHLFMQQTGLEPDKHVELHNLGWDSVTKGLEATIHSEAAVPLFDKAKESFRDVACTGLSSWGQVHQLLGQRALEAAARAGKALDEVRPAVLAEFAEAEKRFREALSYNPDFFDGVCNMSQLEFERCKLAAGLMAVDTKGSADASAASTSSSDPAAAKSQEQAAAEAQEALTAATRAALASLQAETVASAKATFEAALEWADKAVVLAPSMDARQKEMQARAAESGQPAPPQPGGEYDYRAQALVLKGNFIYEWSQMLAAVGGEWRPELDRAVALFREAGCPEKDIRVALRNHYKASELDIPADEPEPAKEEEAPAAAAAAPAKPKADAKPEPAAEEKPKAKGLPSLEVKKAKK